MGTRGGMPAPPNAGFCPSLPDLIHSSVPSDGGDLLPDDQAKLSNTLEGRILMSVG